MRNRERMLRVCLAFAVTLAMLFLTVGNSIAELHANGTTEGDVIKEEVINVNGHKVIKQVAYRPSQEDENWPIVYSHKWTAIDDKTGEEIHYYVEIRRSPLKSSPQGTCKVSASLTSDCHYKYSDSIHAQATRGWVTAHVKHYYDRYSNPSDTRPYYDPPKVEIWWTRGDATWTVKNARLGWGCESCWKCAGGWHGYVFWDGPFDPGWSSNYMSWVYRYISPELFEPMKELAADIQAVSYSDVHQACGNGWCYVGELIALADLPDK